jgi:glycosyltransferase involved in cell wall biosynthesis
MRILFCNYEYPPLGGGGGVINAYIAEELATRHEVTVLTSQAMGLPDDTVENGVRVIRVPVLARNKESVASILSLLSFVPRGIRRGKELLRKERFDVVNTHFVLPTGPVGNALSRFAGIPNVLSVHGGDLYDPSKFMSPHRHWVLRLWIRKLLRRADLVVGQSSNTLSNVRQFYTPEIEGVRIPLGILRPGSGAGTRADYGFSEDDVLLVTVGRLVARKGLDQLVRAMESFKGCNVRLLILGSGPQSEALKEDAKARGLQDQVRLMGRVDEDEKIGLLRMSDLYVSTSQHEGFGLVFLEGMATGLPVVCYDNGGQTDFLKDGVTGHVVPLNDLEAFQARCSQLIDDPNRCRQMGDENLKQVEAYFIDQCALQYENAFRRVLERATEARFDQTTRA